MLLDFKKGFEESLPKERSPRGMIYRFIERRKASKNKDPGGGKNRVSS